MEAYPTYSCDAAVDYIAWHDSHLLPLEKICASIVRILKCILVPLRMQECISWLRTSMHITSHINHFGKSWLRVIPCWLMSATVPNVMSIVHLRPFEAIHRDAPHWTWFTSFQISFTFLSVTTHTTQYGLLDQIHKSISSKFREQRSVDNWQKSQQQTCTAHWEQYFVMWLVFDTLQSSHSNAWMSILHYESENHHWHATLMLSQRLGITQNAASLYLDHHIVTEWLDTN